MRTPGSEMLVPPDRQAVIDSQEIEEPPSHEVHQILDRGWLKIETRRKWGHDRSSLSHSSHRFDLRHTDRRLSMGNHQWPTFLEGHLGRALHQIIADAMGDLGQGIARSRDDHHAIMFEGAAGASGTDVISRMNHESGTMTSTQGIRIQLGNSHLFGKKPLSEVGAGDVGLDPGCGEKLDHPNGITRPARSGDPHDNAAWRASKGGVRF